MEVSDHTDLLTPKMEPNGTSSALHTALNGFALEGQTFDRQLPPDQSQAWTQYRPQKVEDSPCVAPQFKVESCMPDSPEIRSWSTMIFAMDVHGPSPPSSECSLTNGVNDLSHSFRSLGGTADNYPSSPAMADCSRFSAENASASALGIITNTTLGNHNPSTPPCKPLSHQALLTEPFDMSLASLSTSAPSHHSLPEVGHHDLAYFCPPHYQLYQQQHSHLAPQLLVHHHYRSSEMVPSWSLSSLQATNMVHPAAVGIHLLDQDFAAFGSQSRASMANADSSTILPLTPILHPVRCRSHSVVSYAAVDLPSPSPSSPCLSSSTSLSSDPPSPAPDKSKAIVEINSSSTVEVGEDESILMVTTASSATSTIDSTDSPRRTKPMYACHFANCKRTFTRPFNLRSHGLTHEPMRPYHCDQCPRSFSRIHDRNRHVRGHLQYKAFCCPVCLGRFVRQDAVTRHLKLYDETNGCAIILKQRGLSFRDAAAGRIRHESLGDEEDIQASLCKFTAELRMNRLMARKQLKEQEQRQQSLKHQSTIMALTENDLLGFDDDGGVGDESNTKEEDL